LRTIKILALASVLGGAVAAAAAEAPPPATPDVAVGPQYGLTHVYVPFADFDRFVTSFVATFGGTTSKAAIVTVTPQPSLAKSQIVFTPVGNVSVFGFTTPVPFPFGAERTGSLVTDLDAAVEAARANGADVIVAPFADAIGRDAVIQWPGGVNMQLYWHTSPPSYPPLASVPENRIYVSKDRAEAFIRDFLAFSHGAIVSDEPAAPGVEIGRVGETYRRVRIESKLGKVVALVTDGHLRWPYGRELAGYEVSSMAETLEKATAAGVEVLIAPTTADRRVAAMVRFPGGYIAEIHAAVRP